MTQHAHFHALLHSADLLEKRLTERLAPLGVRPRQARILVAIDVIGPTSQTILASEFDITKGSMSTMIDRLLSLDLVAREKSKTDMRGDIVSLTTKGTALIADIHHAWSDMDVIMEEALGVDKKQRLCTLARELVMALGGKIPGKS
ncbi:MarR family winged helix-turn-helix transcriptional regulator [Shimia thalassica]|uniref:MarR family winged helix-turn-helix transcriptional regulator n=1 Tax=Shimia thalassica TaxID=1715693 RepID=UPI0026E16255|nr:MarR family winged helix-turn-helix transcriptional regulator [Shimia thalassica]MDO6522873.1 MarR family winged helix-turn-helix transcriptional regulator [Shimia thalassica]MDP2579932.1 MarR family winged helix-turn-helix transcriptional regulator [Shimia thalassica]